MVFQRYSIPVTLVSRNLLRFGLSIPKLDLVISSTGFIWSAFTVMVSVNGLPIQEPEFGVMDIMRLLGFLKH